MKLQLHHISVEPSTINSTSSNPLKFGLKSNLYQLQTDTVEISSDSIKNNKLAFKGKVYNEEATKKLAEQISEHELLTEINESWINKAMKLIKGGADPNVQCKNKETILHILSLYVDAPDYINLLIDKGADINIQNSDGNTPLHLAYKNRNAKTVRTLFKKGANPNLGNKNRETFIDLICLDLEKNKAQTKTNNNIEAKIKKSTKSTELTQAKKATKDLKKILDSIEDTIDKETFDRVTKLIDKGADSNVRDCYTWTALHLITKSYDSPEMVETLVKKGASINIQEKEDGWTPLHLAVYNRRYEVVKKLLELGADPNIQENDNISPFSMLVSESSDDDQNAIALIEYFVKHGADINGRGYFDSNSTIVNCAAYDGKKNITRKLLELGADPYITNSDGYNAFDTDEFDFKKMYNEVMYEKA